MKLEEFDKQVVRTILELREELAPFLRKLDINKLSKHNRAYLKYSEDPVKSFIDGELIRHMNTVNFIYLTKPKSAVVLDIGFMIPIIPIGLSKLGFKVHTIEKLSYYDGALDELIAYSNKMYNIEVIDFDLFADNITALKHKFDVILLLAVIEHLNGTPKYMLDKLKTIAKPQSDIIVEVPNIASFTKRVCFLMSGRWNNPPYEDYFNSCYPFSGHNREYTINDLKYALDNSGFDVLKISAFHHSLIKPQTLFMKLLYAMELIGPQSWKPNIWAVAKSR